MKKLLLFLVLFFIFLVPLSYGLVLNVNIKSQIGGVIDYLNYSKKINSTPQEILINWANIESIGCDVRFRVDIYQNTSNGSKLVYTGWSEKKGIEPGDHGLFKIYWFPKNLSGNFTGKIRLYSCAEIFNVEKNISFEVIKPKQTFNETKDFDVNVETTKKWVDIKIKANKDIKDLIIIPKEYPIGWIFESEKIDEIKEGEEKTIRLNYEASIWKPVGITLELVTMDGKDYKTLQFILAEKKEFPWNQVIIAVLSIIILILISINLKNIKLIRKIR